MNISFLSLEKKCSSLVGKCLISADCWGKGRKKGRKKRSYPTRVKGSLCSRASRVEGLEIVVVDRKARRKKKMKTRKKEEPCPAN